ncbi:endonuclease/exonuclease/phosphatase family protein [Oceanirhabdus seepicola]|uniref:Endonuclease/exonuclease/phosphatase family protein n=1 Tax=Oceanirhabdus seepicola TaxID=2828781 RepID=A0A9J6P5Y6_9CLOT|nr:endonuclease/exonuclease/phosphatase family protein [Oceanirhabdus seepicola]MCM1991513.1 endonuclease/exonuclease/phosphatase family protein [Oceanirhabdus seepicola]
MKILTYNIWVSEKDFDIRLELLCEVIKQNNVDIIGLQEVRDEGVVNYIREKCGYEYSLWKKYHDCEEGLAILSRYPIIHSETNWEENEEIHNSGVLRTVIDYKGMNIGVTNVHLDYKSALNREIEIVKAIKRIKKYETTDYEFIIGDFNSYENSSVHRYLTGEQSLDNHATWWIDLAESYAVKHNMKAKVTLDFKNNPRWDSEYAIEVPGRFDWVMLEYPYPKVSPKLVEVEVIGNHRVNNLTPSDHYGVVCDLEFEQY